MALRVCIITCEIFSKFNAASLQIEHTESCLESIIVNVLCNSKFI